MGIKIGVLADPHAMPQPLAEALALFACEGVTLTLCAGDIAGYGEALDETIALLQGAGCHSVIGNHDAWSLASDTGEMSAAARAYLQALPPSLSLRVEGAGVYLVHAHPPQENRGGIRLLDQEGGLIDEQCAAWAAELQGLGHEVLVVGHTHQVFAEQLGDTLVINPGSTAFNHSCAILTLPQRRVEFFALGGHKIRRIWNWGLERAAMDGGA